MILINLSSSIDENTGHLSNYNMCYLLADATTFPWPRYPLVVNASAYHFQFVTAKVYPYMRVWTYLSVCNYWQNGLQTFLEG